MSLMFEEKCRNILKSVMKNGTNKVIVKKWLIDSVCRSNKSYYPQALLEDCKYNVEDKERNRFLTGGFKVLISICHN